MLHTCKFPTKSTFPIDGTQTPLEMRVDALHLLFQLEYMDLSWNRLSGTLPNSLAGLAQVCHAAKSS